MPNWCMNYLYIGGEQGDISSFLTDFKKEGNYSLNTLYPVPDEAYFKQVQQEVANIKELKSTQEISDDFYDLVQHRRLATNEWEWCVQNWGTKWDIDCDDYDELDYSPESGLYFQSAWSPPIDFFHHISDKYPNLTFTIYYFEPGVFFAGVVQIKNKEVLEDTHYGAENGLENVDKFLKENEHVFGDFEDWIDRGEGVEI